jgi:DNA helicase-2/ATP-dependent DNA helicase PcrA
MQTRPLNIQQQEAVEHTEGPLLVLAGAGTGKTLVITNRIVHLLREGKAQPHEILATTFTNKAAGEMRERIFKLASHALPWLGTFHSIAAKILRNNAEHLNLTKSFSILDADDQVKLVKTVTLELNIDHKRFDPKVTNTIIQLWKDSGLTPLDLSGIDIKTERERIALRIYPIYQKKLIAMDAVDFGDLLLHNIEIFKKAPDILAKYQALFKYIMVDEYQDTNTVQHIWLGKLAHLHNNVCCVGDDDQSIYSWRGAKVGNILSFQTNFPQAKIVKLEQNYRSTKHILKAAASLISNNNFRHDKTVWTNTDSAAKIAIKACRSDKEEAEFIVYKIKYQHKDTTTAILVRALFQTRIIEESLSRNLVPYKVIGSLKFYERQEIKDMLAYMRLVIKPADDMAFERIINTPARGIGDTSIQKIKGVAAQLGLSLFNASEQIIQDSALLGTQTTGRLAIFVKLVKSWQTAASDHVLLATRIAEESGYMAMIKAEDGSGPTRVENVKELFKAMGTFDNLQDFLEHVSLVNEHDKEAKGTNMVTLMSLHAAKGLEFDTVFLPGWEEDLFPHSKSINEDAMTGLEEERRLAYVGITRAKRQLYISYATSRRVYNQWVYSQPSRFLAEIPQECCTVI